MRGIPDGGDDDATERAGGVADDLPLIHILQSTGDESLTEDKDADSAVTAAACATVSLRNLDGSGYLRGKWVTVQSATGTPAFSPTNAFFYTRHDDRFEQVMAYFWVCLLYTSRCV